MNPKPFTEIFKDCPFEACDSEAIHTLQVENVKVLSSLRRMEVQLTQAAAQADDTLILRLEKTLAFHYQLSQVKITTPGRSPIHKEPSPGAAKRYTWGRSGKQEPIPVSQVYDSTGLVVVEGEIFAVDVRETRNKTGLFVNIDITDFEDSLRLNRFVRTEESAALLDGLRKGLTVRALGKMEADRFSRDGAAQFRVEGLWQIDPVVRQDTAEDKRVELHLHTNMSAMDATGSPADVVALAARLGHAAVAVTDHGVVHSFPDFYAASGKMAKQGTPVKVIYGCEAYFIRDDLAEDWDKQKRRAYHMILLARNQTGLQNLYRLVSGAHIDHFHYQANVVKSLLDTCREGLLVGSACEAGELFSAVVDGASDEELIAIASYYDYLEIQPLCNNAFLIEKGIAADVETLRAYNRKIVQLGQTLGKPVAATGDVHFLEPRDEVYRRILLASKGMNYGSRPLPLYFKTTDEMLKEFSYLGEETARAVVIDAPAALAALCEEVRPVRPGQFFPKLPGSAEELRRLCEERSRALYGDNLPPVLQERMELELGNIIRGGFDIIYMISQKLVARSLEEGYLVGSRGSVGSSIVAYMAGITEVNALPPHYRCSPCRYWDFPETDRACGADLPDQLCPHCGQKAQKDGFDIPFATFLGFEADKKPDIDLNFSGEYQARAHQHTLELFGEGKVFRAGTIGTVAEKTAIGFVKKYLEEEGREVSQAELSRLASGFVGVKRTTGQHPGGLIIVPDENDISEFCPVQRPADKRDTDIITTHFDYHSIEENLLKLDLLGHDDPTMIRRLEELTGVDAKGIPLDDPDTMSLFTSTKALGIEKDPLLGVTGACAIPEFGTKFVREMLTATQPTTFDELVRISGLSHGTDVWLGNAADLVKAGTATLKEVICARDDIMLYLIGKGLERKLAFTIMESVRKGKGLKPEWEDAMRAAQTPEWYIESCKKIKYMFPKAHAVAYVIMAFRIAWFKVHHPLAFYAAYFSIRAAAVDAARMMRGMDVCLMHIDQLEKADNLKEAEKDLLSALEVCYEYYKRGFSFAPIDIYRSDATRFLIEDGQLRPPFVAVPGLGEVAALDIVAQRQDGPFLSVDELAGRCRKVSQTHLEQLGALGALEGLPRSTQLTLFE